MTVKHGENPRIDWEDVSGPSRQARALGIGHKVSPCNEVTAPTAHLKTGTNVLNNGWMMMNDYAFEWGDGVIPAGNCQSVLAEDLAKLQHLL